MITITSIIEHFEPDYLRQCDASSLPSHARALHAMKRCPPPVGPAHAGALRRV